jgi:hypothetical protein
MDHVTALAEAFEIAHAVVAGVMIKIGSRQDYPGLPLLHYPHEVGPTSRAAAAGAPNMRRRVEPPPVRQAANLLTVRCRFPCMNYLIHAGYFGFYTERVGNCWWSVPASGKRVCVRLD